MKKLVLLGCLVVSACGPFQPDPNYDPSEGLALMSLGLGMMSSQPAPAVFVPPPVFTAPAPPTQTFCSGFNGGFACNSY